MDGKDEHVFDAKGEGGTVDKLRAKQEKKDMKKAKKKAAKNSARGSTEDTSAAVSTKELEVQEKVRKLVNQLAIRDAIQPVSGSSSSQKQKDMSSHKFWSTQPVPKHGETVEDDGPIEPNTPHDQIRKEPYVLPKEFEWTTLDLNNEPDLNELYTLLTNNYVEDDDAMFRFDYSGDFLKWALQPPGYLKIWHVGVRVSSNKKLVAFVSGIPADIRIYDSHQHLVEINFLCVHKKLRSKRLAPVLIKEITRRSHLQGIFQAVYTAGVVLPRPIAKARPMLKKDVPEVRALLNEYMSKFNFVPVFKTDDEVKHWILTREGVVWSFVVEDPETKKVTDFFSFYYLPSSVIGHQVHKTINAVYLFYYAVKESDEKATKGRLQSLMKDALILAKLKSVDVFNCLDLLENQLFIEELKFGPGDGYLNYYMYNWRCREMGSEKVGVVML
ncbi:8886_t:CDS:2 [Funneliformis mosseae]|uniref:Glycylpeptide N-tetradecanoyltransferase n=2 Tax=Funneliformis TaxID=1117308 RepID=A0A9N9B1X8_FUNMO|nr:8886_t:CDS:2 [Funneliformis mosseae]